MTTSQTVQSSLAQPEAPAASPAPRDRPNLVASIPFFAMHLAVGLAYFTGVSWKLLLLAVVSYYLQMFAVTAGYHRYFSHRAFKTSRGVQFVLAFLAECSVQKGVLWWAANHRHHHRYSDFEEDIHSPVWRGFWYSHVGWILSDRYVETKFEGIRDFARFPELRFLNRFHLVPPTLTFVALFLVGGLPWLVWGGFIPTVASWHATFFINSLTHMFGKRRYLTTDTSRNSFLLAVVCSGEGWHNNHHFHQNTANQGWFWWEVDFTYYALKVLSWLGLVWDLRTPAKQTKYAFTKYTEAERARLKVESRFGMFLNSKRPVRALGRFVAREKVVVKPTIEVAASPQGMP